MSHPIPSSQATISVPGRAANFALRLWNFLCRWLGLLFSPKHPASRVAFLVLVGALAFFLAESTLFLALDGKLRVFESRKAMVWVVSSFCVSSVLLGLYALSNRLGFALVMTATGLYVVYGAHLNKTRILNRALMPWDLLNGREVIALFPTMLTSWSSALIVLVLLALLVFAVVLLFRKSRYPLPLWARALALVVAVSIPAPLVYYRTLDLDRTLRHMRITNRVWDHDHNIRTNGLLLSLLLNARSLSVSTPEGYAEERIRELLEARGNAPGSRSALAGGDRQGAEEDEKLSEQLLAAQNPEGKEGQPAENRPDEDGLLNSELDASPSSASEQNPRQEGAEGEEVESDARFAVLTPGSPATGADSKTELGPGDVDVIMYMSESFWDPLELGVPLSEDPIPFVRELMKSRPSGRLHCPMFGGGTANSEFELLTGIPINFLPSGSYPYQHYVHRYTPSLVSTFKSHGYRAVALHPFHRWFWSRETVYPMLGFDEAQFMDEFQDAELAGRYISDEALVDRILEKLNSAEEPTFIFAITMSTHGPFDFEPSTEPAIKVEGGLSPVATRALENFVNAMALADRAFERLVAELEKRERPTLVVLFGDHLPPLAAQGVFDEAEFTANLAERGRTYAEQMYQVPLLFWANYPLEKENFRLSANYLPPKVLSAAGIPLDPYHSYLQELSVKLPIFSPNEIQAGDGSFHSLEGLQKGTDELAEWVRGYELLAWDRLFGQQYSDPAKDLAGDGRRASVER